MSRPVPGRPRPAARAAALLPALLLAAFSPTTDPTPDNASSGARERILMEVVDTLERDLARLGARQRQLAAQEEKVTARLHRVEGDLTRADAAIAAATAKMTVLVRSLVRMKEPDDLLLYFSTGRYHDLHVYKRLVRETTSRMSGRLAELAKRRATLAGRREAWQAELTRLEAERQAVVEEEAQVAQTLERKRKALSDRMAQVAAVETLFMSIPSVTGIEDLMSVPEPAPKVPEPVLAGFGEAKGKGALRIPVSPGRVLKGFEKPAAAPYGSEKMTRGWILVPFVEGKKAAAAQTAFVQVPYAGKVVFLGTIPGYGTTIIVDHGEGYHTVYANLSRTHVVKGDFVAAGDTIATIRSLSRKELPYLYFEVRESRQAVDPKPWFLLRSVLTPAAAEPPPAKKPGAAGVNDP